MNLQRDVVLESSRSTFRKVSTPSTPRNRHLPFWLGPSTQLSEVQVGGLTVYLAFSFCEGTQ